MINSDAESHWEDIARTWLRDPNREPVDDANLISALKRVIQSADMAKTSPLVAKIKKQAMDAAILATSGLDPTLAIELDEG